MRVSRKNMSSYLQDNPDQEVLLRKQFEDSKGVTQNQFNIAFPYKEEDFREWIYWNCVASLGYDILSAFAKENKIKTRDLETYAVYTLCEDLQMYAQGEEWSFKLAGEFITSNGLWDVISEKKMISWFYEADFQEVRKEIELIKN